MFDRVLTSLKEGSIVGVDFTGISHLGAGSSRVHIWVYSNHNRFVPILQYEGSLSESEVVKLIDAFGGKLWTHDDEYPDLTAGVKVRYLSAVEPCGCTFFAANQ